MSTRRSHHTHLSWFSLLLAVGCATATVDEGAGDGDDTTQLPEGDGDMMGDGDAVSSSGGVVLGMASGGAPAGNGGSASGGVTIGDGDGDLVGDGDGDLVGDGDTGGAAMGDGDGDTGGGSSGGASSGGAASGGAAADMMTGGASSGGTVGSGDCAGVDGFVLGGGSDYAEGATVVSTCAGGTPCAGLSDGEMYEFSCIDQYNCGTQDPGKTNWSDPPWEVVQACN